MPKLITLEELKDKLQDTLEKMPQAVKERAESLAKSTAIGDIENPDLLVIDASQRKEWEEFTWLFLSALLAIAGIQVITPEDSDYEKLKSIVGKKEKG